MGPVAVPAHLHVGQGILQGGGLAADDLGNLGEETPDPSRNRLPYEQIVELREPAGTVEVHDLHRIHIHSGPP